MKYKFSGLYTDRDKKKFRVAQESDLKKICDYLDVNPQLLERVNYEVFDTREGKQNADPNHSISRASARYNEMAIYRFWLPTEDPHFPHEITHLVAHTWARPYILDTDLDTWDGKKIQKKIEMVSTSFMQEGLAIAVDDILFKRKLMEDGEHKYIDEWCNEQIGKMPTSISQVVNIDGFGAFENKIVVPFAASLSKLLLLNFGLPKYREMYIRIKETVEPALNVKVIEDVYGINESNIIDKWRSSLQAPSKSS